MDQCFEAVVSGAKDIWLVKNTVLTIPKGNIWALTQDLVVIMTYH